jgi:penicillin-binding protein-related factor A (putative recombinase)
MKSRCEAAMRLAERTYRKQGRCYIDDRPTPTYTRADGSKGFASRAPIDFRGTIPGGRAYAREAKDTSEASFPLAQLREDQRDALDAVLALGADVGVVIAFLPGWTVFDVPWRPLAEFVRNPWRQSLTQEMCAAWGMLLPYSDGRVWFLDGKPHPNKLDLIDVIAREAVAARIAQAKNDDEPRKVRRRKDQPRTPDGKLDLIGGMRWGAKARGIK